MSRRKLSRVNFENPPVIEVAVAVQFDAITRLTTPQLGAFWQSLSGEFPRVEEYVARPPTFETFPQQHLPVERLQFQIGGKAPVSRCWFVSEDDSRLIQIQADRFVFNWRKRSAEYPRYEYVRQQFDKFLAVFRAFVDDHELGEIHPNQCEVSYVNRIDGTSPDLARVSPLWAGHHTTDFLGEPQSIRTATSYKIQTEGEDEPEGRLHVTQRYDIEPDPHILLTMVARGAPRPATWEGVSNFLDLGHDWIVHGFLAVTTLEMQDSWGRKNGD